ncbi:MAG TPA: glycosyltransferase family 4 protein [Beijerinckiaceae bacterium]|nr:glycosyltransferase family 4 protein [Beijerinckiaceae bacterium]
MERGPTVLHLISSLKIGGAERLLVSMMRAAKATGGQRFVICVMNRDVDDGLRAELTATGFPVVWLGRREGHLSPRYLRAIVALVDTYGIDIIHTHNDGSRTWGMLAKLLRPRLKLVYTVHAEGIGRQITGLKRLAYHRMVDASVAISSFVAGECESFGARLVRTIENGVPLEAFRRTAPRTPRPSGAPLQLVNVARFAAIKGQDILIEALAMVRARGLDAHLTLVGVASEPAFHAALTDQVARQGLGAHVRFVTNRTSFADILHAGDAFVLPSREEGFGLVLIEAMAAGIPVIASRTGGPADLVRHGANGLLFERLDAPDLANKVIQLAADPALAARCIAGGQATAEGYDIHRTLEQHRALYDALVPAGAQTRSSLNGAQGEVTNRLSETPPSFRATP